MKQRPDSITDLPASPGDDRRRRARIYIILMIVRVSCLLLFLVVPGWWKVPLAIGAVVLPWFAVTLGTVGSGRSPQGAEHVVQGELESGSGEAPTRDEGQTR